jgi:ribosome-associated translation inhibitor RaiA
MTSLDLPIEFHTEIEQNRARLREEAEGRIRKLAEGHKDITGAMVTIDQPAHGETPYLYEANVVLYMRPNNVAADQKAEDPLGALKGSLTAVERQARAQRAKLREHWKRPDLGAQEGGEGPALP